jgi:hypothetical protein
MPIPEAGGGDLHVHVNIGDISIEGMSPSQSRQMMSDIAHQAVKKAIDAIPQDKALKLLRGKGYHS